MIKQFKDEFSWLSNMTPFENPLIYDGLSYRTNEHFYVAMKSTDAEFRKLISETQSPGKVKRLGRKEPLRKDWDLVKQAFMLYGLRYKFSSNNPVLREKLLDTKNQYIQEGNTWGDQYWGYDLIEEYGKNYLGRLLMKVRKEINLE